MVREISRLSTIAVRRYVRNQLAPGRTIYNPLDVYTLASALETYQTKFNRMPIKGWKWVKPAFKLETRWEAIRRDLSWRLKSPHAWYSLMYINRS